MKKIGKIQINPEKVMNNEELLQLRGGYAENCCMCRRVGEELGYMIGATPENCHILCAEAYFGAYGTWDCLV